MNNVYLVPPRDAEHWAPSALAELIDMQKTWLYHGAGPAPPDANNPADSWALSYGLASVPGHVSISGWGPMTCARTRHDVETLVRVNGGLATSPDRTIAEVYPWHQKVSDGVPSPNHPTLRYLESPRPPAGDRPILAGRPITVSLLEDGVDDIFRTLSQELWYHCGFTMSTSTAAGAPRYSVVDVPAHDAPLTNVTWVNATRSASVLHVDGLGVYLLTCHSYGGLRAHRVREEALLSMRSTCNLTAAEFFEEPVQLLEPGQGCLYADVGDLTGDGVKDLLYVGVEPTSVPAPELYKREAHWLVPLVPIFHSVESLEQQRERLIAQGGAVFNYTSGLFLLRGLSSGVSVRDRFDLAGAELLLWNKTITSFTLQDVDGDGWLDVVATPPFMWARGLRGASTTVSNWYTIMDPGLPVGDWIPTGAVRLGAESLRLLFTGSYLRTVNTVNPLPSTGERLRAELANDHYMSLLIGPAALPAGRVLSPWSTAEATPVNLSSATPSAWAPIKSMLGPSASAVVLALSSPASTSILVFSGDFASLSVELVLPSGAADAPCTELLADDFGRGVEDVLCLRSTGELVVWKNQGTPTEPAFPSEAVPVLENATLDAASLLVSGPATQVMVQGANATLFLEPRDAGLWATVDGVALPPDCRWPLVADLSADGLLDVVCVAADMQLDVYVAPLSGAARRLATPPVPPYVRLQAVDVNADGVLDIVGPGVAVQTLPGGEVSVVWPQASRDIPSSARHARVVQWMHAPGPDKLELEPGTGEFHRWANQLNSMTLSTLTVSVDADQGDDSMCRMDAAQPCSSINAALEVARATAGGGILVRVLNSRILLDTPVWLSGAVGRLVTIEVREGGLELDCSVVAASVTSRQSGASCVTFTAPLAGIRFRGGAVTVVGWQPPALDWIGGAVQFSSADFSGNSIGHEDVAAVPHWLRVVGATTTVSGACMSIVHASNLVLRGVHCSGCHSRASGGAVHVSQSTNVTLSNSLFENCSTDERGGALFADGVDDLALTDVSVIGAQASDAGGGLYLLSSQRAILRRVTVQGSHAPRCGGVHIVLSSVADARVWLEDVVLESNSALSTDGGGACFSSASVEFAGDRSTFRNNTAARNGGGAHMESGILTLPDAAGVLLVGNHAHTGGGGGWYFSGATASLRGELWALNNTASDGGGVFVAPESNVEASALYAEHNVVSGNGGGVAVERAVFGQVGGRVAHNRARRGGGVSCTSSAAGNDASVSFAGAVLANNEASGPGGGVYVLLCEAAMSGSTWLFQNVASGGGGGAHISTTFPVDMAESVVFEKCRTLGTTGGGGLHIALISIVAAEARIAAAFRSNSAPDGSGGAMYIDADVSYRPPTLLTPASNMTGNTARAAPNVGSSTNTLYVVDAPSAVQESGALLRGGLVLETRDINGARTIEDSRTVVVLEVVSATDPRAQFSGTAARLTAQAGVLNFTGKEVRLFAPPGSTVRARVSPESESLDVLPTAEFEVQMAVCQAGFFVQDGLFCSPCPAGSSSTEVNALSCELCPEHHVAPEAGTPGCQRCAWPTWATGLGNVECRLCDATEYAVFVNSSFQRCETCPDDRALCFLDGRVEARPGFWVDRDASSGEIEAFVCSNPNNCVGGGCDSTRRQPASDNLLCAECAEGRYEWNGECVKCDGVRLDLVAFLVTVCVVFVYVYHRLSQTSSAELKITIFFIQCIILFVGPENGILLYSTQVFNSNFARAAGSNCIAPLDPHEQLQLNLLSPFAVYVAWLALMLWSLLWHRVCCGRRRNVQQGSISRLELGQPVGFDTKAWIRSLVALYLFSFNAVATATLQYYHCVEITHAGEPVEVVQAIPAVRCDSDEYRATAPFTAAIVVVYLIGVPCFLFGLLFVKRAKLEEPSVKRVLGVLTSVFRPPMWMWQFVVLARRTVLVVSAVQLAAARIDRLVTLSLLNFAATLLQIYVVPWRNEGDNMADTLSLTLLTLLTVAMPLLSEPYSSTDNLVLMFSTMVPMTCFLLWTAKAKIARALKRFGVLRRAGSSRLRGTDTVARSASGGIAAHPSATNLHAHTGGVVKEVRPEQHPEPRPEARPKARPQETDDNSDAAERSVSNQNLKLSWVSSSRAE